MNSKDYTEDQKKALYKVSMDCHERGGSIEDHMTLQEGNQLHDLGLYIIWDEGKLGGIRPE